MVKMVRVNCVNFILIKIFEFIKENVSNIYFLQSEGFEYFCTLNDQNLKIILS